MKTLAHITLSGLALFLSACGSGGSSNDSSNNNSNLPSGGSLPTITEIPAQRLEALLPLNHRIDSQDDNVSNIVFGVPDYRIMAVAMNKFISPNIRMDENNDTYPVYHIEMLHDYMTYNGEPYENSVITEVDEWDKGDTKFQFEGLKIKKLYANYEKKVFSDNTEKRTFVASGTSYTDEDHPENNYENSIDIKVHEDTNVTSFVFNDMSNTDKIYIEAVEPNHNKICYSVLYLNDVELKNGNYEWGIDYKLQQNDVSSGMETTWKNYKGSGEKATLSIVSNYDANGFFTNYNYDSASSNYDYNGEYDADTPTNPTYANHRHMVQLGHIGNGDYYNKTKPMYEVLSCNVSNDSYAVFDGDGNLVECHEDLDRDSIIDKVTKYTWYDEWRLDSIETQENNNTILEDFQYFDFGNVSRIVKYVNGQYESHRKYIYIKSLIHTQAN